MLPSLAVAGPIGDWYAARTDKDLIRSVQAINAPGAVTNTIPATTNVSDREVWAVKIAHDFTNIVDVANITQSDRTNPVSVLTKGAAWVNTFNTNNRPIAIFRFSLFLDEALRRLDGSTPDTSPTITTVIPARPQHAPSFAMTNIGRAVTGVADLEALIGSGQ